MNDTNMHVAETLIEINLATLVKDGTLQHPDTWRQTTGDPLTPVQRDHVMQAREQEWRAASALMALRVVTVEHAAEISSELERLARPYFEAGCQTMGEVRDMIHRFGSAEVRAEFDAQVHLFLASVGDDG